MDPLSILCNSMWQDAIRPRHPVSRQKSSGKIAAYLRRQGEWLRSAAPSESADRKGLARIKRVGR